MIRIMYEELSEYINTNDVKLETMIMDENDFKVLAKNEIMLRAFSEYVRQALETIHKIKMPITLKFFQKCRIYNGLTNVIPFILLPCASSFLLKN